MNLDDLLLKDKPLLRVKTYKIDGVGDLEIHELSALERADYFADADNVVKGDLSDAEFTAKWLWRLLAGPSRAYEPGASRFRSLLSHDQIGAIFNHGVRFATAEVVEKAKKR